MPNLSSSSRPFRASRVVTACVVFATLAAVSAACGNSDDSPGLVDNVNGNGNGVTSTSKDASVDATATDAAADSQALGDSGIGCSDGIKDNLETDVDCGGTVCPQCIDGKACVNKTDCIGGGCDNKTCDTPTCNDKFLNGTETDTDCGGSCPACTVGRKCVASTDCSSGACSNGACACPAQMVIVPQAELLGGAYCIDVTEVTKGQYNAFLTANYPIENQVSGCSGNSTYTPRGDWPPAAVPTNVAVGYPVRYVDWCDAYAFCAHAGKELCGNIGGGKLPDGLDATVLDRANSGTATVDASAVPLDAWYNACSAQGENVWPYDVSTFSPGTCNDGSASTLVTPTSAAAPWPDYDSGNNITDAGCQGGIFGLFQMSGNVAEWENACAATTGSTDSCVVRGGAFDSSYANLATTDLQCKWQSDETRQRVPAEADDATLADVGFRCCQY